MELGMAGLKRSFSTHSAFHTQIYPDFHIPLYTAMKASCASVCWEKLLSGCFPGGYIFMKAIHRMRCASVSGRLPVWEYRD